MRAVHRAVIAAAVTGAFAAARRWSRPGEPSVAGPDLPVVPQQRSGLEELGLRVEDLVVAEHDAQDARLFDALDWSPR
jgi:hypothetical protein